MHDAAYTTIPTRDYMLKRPWLCEISRSDGLRIRHRDTGVVAWTSPQAPEMDEAGRMADPRDPAYLAMLAIARELNVPGPVSPVRRRSLTGV